MIEGRHEIGSDFRHLFLSYGGRTGLLVGLEGVFKGATVIGCASIPESTENAGDERQRKIRIARNQFLVASETWSRARWQLAAKSRLQSLGGCLPILAVEFDLAKDSYARWEHVKWNSEPLFSLTVNLAVVSYQGLNIWRNSGNNEFGRRPDLFHPKYAVPARQVPIAPGFYTKPRGSILWKLQESRS